MTWDTIQQVVRIILYSIGAALLGKGVADGAQFQALLGGLMNVGAFLWWWFWDKKRTA